jgi:hypothetical protein
LLRIKGLLIIFVLCLGAVYNKAANAESFLGVQAINVGEIRENDSSTMNYTYVVEDWKRDVKIDAWGGISVTDQCVVTNNSNESLQIVSLYLPSNASAITAQDIFGTYGQTSLTITKFETYVAVRIYLRNSLSSQQKTNLLAAYSLPSNIYISQKGWQDYTINISLNKPTDWFVKHFMLVVGLPEGAEYQAASKTPSLVQKSGFSVSVEYAEANFTQTNESTITLQYQYFILWAIFRPALWTGIAVAIFSAIFFTRRKFKSSAAIVSTVPFSSSLLRDFVNRYEERRRLRSELESMENQIEKGKLSRRKYRLRKSSVDDHISRLDKELLELRNKIAAASEQNLERMKHLNKAEAEIETLKNDIERAEARFLRKEITAEARRKMLDECNRMKERAENTIEETLLRLKEEIH